MNRESMEFDAVIVGAGPAGLSAAIRLKQLAQTNSLPLSVCVLEKGAEVGANILSGAVIETRALDELIPNWKEKHAPLNTLATDDYFYLLSKKHRLRLPTPPQMHNQGNYIVSLSDFCRWLGEQAVALGVDIFPGFAATELLYDENGHVNGIVTGDMGLDKQGNPTAQFQAGIAIYSKQVFLAEGCRGSVTKQVIAKFGLDKTSQPQTYGIGIKELWQVTPEQHKAGTVIHTAGWPLDQQTYGGTFIYHLENYQIAVGMVIGLDYTNTYLNPFEELQRFKTHPAIRPLFEGGQRIGYGARAISEGGWQSIPNLSIPGVTIIGDSAGFLNVPKIKGTHTAMKSGMVAAECFAAAWQSETLHNALPYRAALDQSWLMSELYTARNIRPAFRAGLLPGLLYAAIDTYLLRGRAPWTLPNHADYRCLRPAKKSRRIEYAKPDGKLTFDRLSSVYLTGTFHDENQPCHLQLKDPSVAIDINLNLFDSPEQRYCPAGVYEIVQNENNLPRLQINAANCIHCKTCDIKDPTQNINWLPPEGGGGPNYNGM